MYAIIIIIINISTYAGDLVHHISTYVTSTFISTLTWSTFQEGLTLWFLNLCNEEKHCTYVHSNVTVCHLIHMQDWYRDYHNTAPDSGGAR